MLYNWQQPDWPDFSFDLKEIEEDLFIFAEQTGHISGILKTMPEDSRLEATIDTMVAEAIKTSAIEGENINKQDVVSSIRNKLGLDKNPVNPKDKKAKGAGELIFDVSNSYKDQLTINKLFSWHRLLLVDTVGIGIGKWRTSDDPMQVVSGAFGKERIHFEAPPSSIVPKEMKRFIKWFNDTAPGGKNEIKKAPIRAAIAHLYFETIHPFEDGNGRIGRAISEKALSQTIGRPIPISLSRTIETDKKAYYTALENAQRGNEITKWLKYFVKTVITAQIQATQLIEFIIKKARFFEQFKDKMNERQTKVIDRMLKAGPQGFEGGLTAKKYISITKTSKATATRDLQELVDLKVLLIQGGGRSTSYLLNLQ